MSPTALALVIGGGVFVIGGGSCLVLGGLAVLGASADEDPAVVEGERLGAPTATGATGAPTATAAPTATTLVEAGDDDDDGGGPATDAAGGAERPPSTGARPPATSTGGGGGTWQCTASGSVRVCGFANVCNYQMVFGNGFGKDRYLASTQAKNACEGMARAKGGSTTCVVQCSAR